MKNLHPFAISALSIFALSGCLATDITQSGFGVGPSMNNLQTGAVSNSLGSVSVRAGTNSEDGAVAFADLNPTAGPVIAPSGFGTATFTGTYNVRGVNVLSYNEGTGILNAITNNDSGAISLDVDFAAGSISGSADDLTVNGSFTAGDTSLSGSVTYDGVGGTLTGVMADDAALGAFHGNSDNATFAGGFAVSEPLALD